MLGALWLFFEMFDIIFKFLCAYIAFHRFIYFTFLFSIHSSRTHLFQFQAYCFHNFPFFFLPLPCNTSNSCHSNDVILVDNIYDHRSQKIFHVMRAYVRWRFINTARRRKKRFISHQNETTKRIYFVNVIKIWQE